MLRSQCTLTKAGNNSDGSTVHPWRLTRKATIMVFVQSILKFVLVNLEFRKLWKEFCKLLKIHPRHCLFKTQAKNSHVTLKTHTKSKARPIQDARQVNGHVSFKDVGQRHPHLVQRGRPKTTACRSNMQAKIESHLTQDASQDRATSNSRWRLRQPRLT